MNVLLTGATGFIGETVLQTLRGQGHDVRAVVRSEKSAATASESGAETVVGDIADGRWLTEQLAGVDGAIHLAQLEAAARKQGFDSLSEVDQCVLEPGGTLTFLAKKPTGEDIRHQELVGKLERLAQEIALLRGSRPPARA